MNEPIAPARAVAQATLPGTLSEILLSDSAGSLMTTCGEAYRFRYEERLEPVRTSSNLFFGGLIDDAASQFIVAHTFGETFDPLASFAQAWDEATADKEIQYPSGFDAEKTKLMGMQMLERFVEDWVARGWTAMLDMEGKPIVQRWLRIRLPGNVVYRGVIDVVVVTRDGKVIIVDLKTTAQHFEEFSLVADQLTGYQVMVEAHADTLGIEQVDGLVFYDLVKRAPLTDKSRKGTTGPTVEVDEPAPPREREELEAWIREQVFIADDIRRRRFSKRPAKAFNSPCKMCDMKNFCWKNDASELRVKPKREYSEAEAPLQGSLC